MTLKEIYQFFQSPPLKFLSQELPVCYVMSVLLQGDSYGTELINILENDYPTYRLSDTVLYNALDFLESEAAITRYWKKVGGRGRPRSMYQLSPQWLLQAQKLTELWQKYMERNHQIARFTANGMTVKEAPEITTKVF